LLAAKVSFRVYAFAWNWKLMRTLLSTASLSLSGSLPIGSIALRQSCHYINKVFLLSDKRRVAALFERKKLRPWKTLTNFQRMLLPGIWPFISTSWNKTSSAGSL
jgi:hypothetical protein